MPKSGSENRKSYSKRSPAQLAALAAGRNARTHGTHIPRVNSRSLRSVPLHNSSSDSTSTAPENSNLQVLLSETSNLLNTALLELKDKQHEVDDFANELELQPRRPGSITVAFFSGSLPVWERFTEEFNEDGGFWGEMRKDKRAKPNSTTHAFNARAMFRRNNTQAYMDANFDEDHHTYIMKEHRKFDSSGVVKKKKKASRDHIQQTVATRRDKRKKLNDKRSAIANHAAKVVIVTDRATLENFTKAQLKDQLAAHRLLDVAIPKLIPAKSNLKNNQQRLDCLILAVEHYLQSPKNGSGDDISDVE
ncbi:hypothetical protein B0H11DRAFT_2254077 [Mycena galericulata]|nr:hypothetical protein B0H11DRAFT_2254077 [Mycena galericulata]